jgi:protein-tyrosine-phosphatase
MAAAFARAIGGSAIVVRSAGSDPAEALNPAVAEVMREKDIDLSGEQPHRLSQEMGWGADVIVTMGCGDTCPIYPGKRYLDWELADPAGRSIDEVRRIRDEIERRVRGLIVELLGLSA